MLLEVRPPLAVGSWIRSIVLSKPTRAKNAQVRLEGQRIETGMQDRMIYAQPFPKWKQLE